MAPHPAARDLRDDAAVLTVPVGQELVVTKDMLVEGVHYTPACPPRDVAWKLVAVNVSDLAGMGGRPLGLLTGIGLPAHRADDWIEAFIAGLAHACERFGCPLLGGDTVRLEGAAVLSATALGNVPSGQAVSRRGARPGDAVWVSGTIGDAGLGLMMALGRAEDVPTLVRRYRRPLPRIALGLSLRGLASGGMDVSDGLLLDARRLAAASGVAMSIDLASVPLSNEARALLPPGDAGLLQAATAGDDYELLFTTPAMLAPKVLEIAKAAGVRVTRIGTVEPGEGLLVRGLSGEALRPERLGYEH